MLKGKLTSPSEGVEAGKGSPADCQGVNAETGYTPSGGLPFGPVAPAQAPAKAPAQAPGGSQRGETPWGGVGGFPGGVAGSLLVSEHKIARNRALRRKRCYHRVMSGLERGGHLRVMMLSTATADRERVVRAWRALVMWGKRRGLLVDYIRVPELTESGYIHYHVVYRGGYIERLVVMRKWYALVGGPEYCPGQKYVYLQRLHSKRGIAHYLAKYMAKGNEGAGNYSWSWGWVWRGFVRDWVALKSAWRMANDWGWGISYGALLAQWRSFVKAGIPP